MYGWVTLRFICGFIISLLDSSSKIWRRYIEKCNSYIRSNKTSRNYVLENLSWTNKIQKCSTQIVTREKAQGAYSYL
jgi:hypothetical protein